jgi:hypothetical protein
MSKQEAQKRSQPRTPKNRTTTGFRISEEFLGGELVKSPSLFILSLGALLLYLIGRLFLLSAAAQAHNPLFALIALLIYPVAVVVLTLVAWIIGLVITEQWHNVGAGLLPFSSCRCWGPCSIACLVLQRNPGNNQRHA